MKTSIYLLLLIIAFASVSVAQEKFELGTQSTQAQRTPRLEVGAQFTSLFVNSPTKVPQFPQLTVQFGDWISVLKLNE